MVAHQKDEGIVPSSERRSAARRLSRGRRGVDVGNDEIRALISAEANARVREAELRDRLAEKLEDRVESVESQVAAVRRRVAAWAGAAAVIGFLAGFAVQWLIRAIAAP